MTALAVAAALGSLASAPGGVIGEAQAGVTFAAVGDSITNANSVDFARGRVGDRSWVDHVGPGLSFVGGWARGGARTADMAAHARPVRADVLVVIAGTNDLAHGVDFRAISRNLEAVVSAVGAARVVVSAVPPRDSSPRVTAEFNRRLARFVEAEGWTFVDAAAGLRSGERFADGMSTDGLHPSREGAEVLAGALSAAISAAWSM